MANRKKKYKITLRSKHIVVVADKFLLLKLFKKLNGRFWGLYGLFFMTAMLMLCFYLTPELVDLSTAFSDFALTAKTAPYFTIGLFVGAYGLWRWRNYLQTSSEHPEFMSLSITAIIVGLYMVAFLPLDINDTVDTLHYYGFALVGLGMIATVLFDLFMRKVRKSKHKLWWQSIRVFCLILIVAGLVVTFLSADRFGPIIDYSLVGELLIAAGFSMWVFARTYQGEGVESGFSKTLSKVLIIK